MYKKITAIVALVFWIAAVVLLLPFDATFNNSQFGAAKVIVAAVGIGVLVNLYRAYKTNAVT